MMCECFIAVVYVIVGSCKPCTARDLHLLLHNKPSYHGTILATTVQSQEGRSKQASCLFDALVFGQQCSYRGLLGVGIAV